MSLFFILKVTSFAASNTIMGYVAALFIGVSLGLIGGGGSILTVPVLVYLFGMSPVVATSYSLFIVGSTSLIGSINCYKNRLIDFRTVFLFGFSSVATVFIIRKFIIHFIPELIYIGKYTIHFSTLTMILFALLMLAAAVSMIRSGTAINERLETNKSPAILLFYGIGLGFITGFLGAGGGFLLMPALVLILRLPVKKAIGTSLFIIALNSLIGFAGDMGHYTINWVLLGTISAIAISGIITGGLMSRKIKAEKLKSGFGWFVLLMGIYILVKEIFL